MNGLMMAITYFMSQRSPLSVVLRVYINEPPRPCRGKTSSWTPFIDALWRRSTLVSSSAVPN
jgi:hypothetical protein